MSFSLAVILTLSIARYRHGSLPIITSLIFFFHFAFSSFTRIVSSVTWIGQIYSFSWCSSYIILLLLIVFTLSSKHNLQHNSLMIIWAATDFVCGISPVLVFDVKRRMQWQRARQENYRLNFIFWGTIAFNKWLHYHEVTPREN